jgi:hypothetical protein
MTTRCRRWYKIPGPLQSLIEGLADKHPTWSPKQIYDDLGEWNAEGEYKYSVVRKYGLPEIRTAERIVKDSRPPDPSGAWAPTEWSGEDAALVLEVLKYLRQMGQGVWLTQAEADRILWVRRVAPTLPIGDVWRIMRRYMAREAKQQPTEYLVLYLAFKSWNGPDEEGAYFAAVPENERYMPNVEVQTSVDTSLSFQIQTKRGPAHSQELEEEK